MVFNITLNPIIFCYFNNNKDIFKKIDQPYLFYAKCDDISKGDKKFKLI